MIKNCGLINDDFMNKRFDNGPFRVGINVEEMGDNHNIKQTSMCGGKKELNLLLGQ